MCARLHGGMQSRTIRRIRRLALIVQSSKSNRACSYAQRPEASLTYRRSTWNVHTLSGCYSRSVRHARMGCKSNLYHGLNLMPISDPLVLHCRRGNLEHCAPYRPHMSQRAMRRVHMTHLSRGCRKGLEKGVSVLPNISGTSSGVSA